MACPLRTVEHPLFDNDFNHSQDYFQVNLAFKSWINQLVKFNNYFKFNYSFTFFESFKSA